MGKVFNKRFYRLLKYVCEDALNGGLGWLYPYYNEAGELSFKHFPAYDILPFWADDDHTILDCAIRYYTQEVWNGYQKEKVEKVEIFKADGIYRYIYQNDMFNTVNADIFTAFNEATMTIVTTALGFDAFVDGAAMLNLENLEGVTIFGFVNPADMAKLRQALKDDLKYVEAYAKHGYVGTVGGINIYTKKNAETGKVVIATKEAVTLFNKKGTEVEQEREGNIRRNTVYSRKYYLAAMTNEAKAVKIITGSAAVTTDTTVSSDKTYYAASGIGYVKVTPASSDNPKTKGWYEITAA